MQWITFNGGQSYLGASPDGLVLCSSVDTLCNGCLEIKCPYSIGGCVTVEFSPKAIVPFSVLLIHDLITLL